LRLLNLVYSHLADDTYMYDEALRTGGGMGIAGLGMPLGVGGNGGGGGAAHYAVSALHHQGHWYDDNKNEIELGQVSYRSLLLVSRSFAGWTTRPFRGPGIRLLRIANGSLRGHFGNYRAGAPGGLGGAESAAQCRPGGGRIRWGWRQHGQRQRWGGQRWQRRQQRRTAPPPAAWPSWPFDARRRSAQ